MQKILPMFIHQQKAREVIKELEKQLAEAYLEFRRKFGRHKVRLVLLSVRSTGPITVTFTKNNKGEFTMNNIAMKKGYTTSATFQGQDATNDPETLTGFAAVVSDTTNLAVSFVANADGTYTVTLKSLGDVQNANVSIGANDANDTALTPLVFGVTVSDLATQIAMTSPWSTPVPVAAAATT